MYVLKRITLFLTLFAVTSTFSLFAFDQTERAGLGAKNYPMEKNYHDRVALIETGEEGARVRLALAEAAQQSIDIAYYTYTRGTFTHIFFASLLSAADRGVHIRILCDGLTRYAYEKKELKDALRAYETHPNIEVKYYEKFNLFKPWGWHKRLHEKIIIVDGRLALIGGRNIGDKYFLEDEYKKRYVNDRDALVYHGGTEPTVIEDMQHYYEQIWEYKHTKAHRKTISKRQKKKGTITKEELRAHYRKVKGEHPELFQSTDWMDRTHPVKATQFVHNPLGRQNKDPWCLRTLLSLAEEAQSSIIVQSPYIIPTNSMRTVIREYAIDMELVSILTNSKRSSPNPIAIGGYYNHRKEIVDTVSQVYEYQGPGSIHSKSYTIDEAISMVGTYNLDSRSSYINTESMLIIHSGEFASSLLQEMQGYRDKSVLVQKDYTYGGEAEDKKPLWLFSKVVGLFEYFL